MIKKIFWIVTPILLIISAVISGFFIYRWGVSNQLPKITQSEEGLQTVQSPSPQPNVEIERKDLKIEVLNGAGIAGIAVLAKTFLEEKGYENVEVGNADNYDFKTTLVEIKESKKNYTDMLIKDLSDKYKASVSSTFLGKESDFDAVVTIGTK